MNAIQWILEVASRNAEREFLIDVVTDETLSFGGVDEAARAVGADLLRRGLARGDRVAIMLNNSASFAKLYFGCLYAGIVTVPINPTLTSKEIDFLLSSCQAKLLVVSPETASQVSLKTITQQKVEVLTLLDGRGPKTNSSQIETWDLSTIKADPSFTPFAGVAPQDTMTLVFTSGTTSRPSGVVHRISDFIDNARLFNRWLQIGPQNRFYGTLAMTYLGGYYNLLMLPYSGEASVVLANAFDARSALNMWQAPHKHAVNTLWLVPTIMSILMEMDRGKEGEAFCRDAVRLALVGTAPLPPTLRHAFEKRYGITLYENYGLSETLFISSNAPFTPVLDGSVGRILPGVQIAITNEGGKALPYGEEGEIRVFTPHLMEGYYDPVRQKLLRLDNSPWFPTGDIGLLSPTGDLYITGRKKDIIIRGGINVSPAAIENVLHEHPAVIECAVVGISHEIYGEDIAAVVRIKPNYKFDDVRRELVKICKKNLGATNQPSVILELEEFPHSSSGKIRKGSIRELLARKLGMPSIFETPKPSVVSRPAEIAMIPSRVKRAIQRPPRQIIEKLATYSVSLISDCLNRLGSMNSSVHALVPGHRFCGPALTVEEVEGGNLMSHAALELLQPGDVLVIDAKGIMTRSCWGGIQTLMAKQRQIAGIVIFGTIRDLAAVNELGVPVYALGVSSGGPLKGWGGNINYPITCAGVVVNPGDVVAGDDDGVVVVPREVADRLPALCERQKAQEEEWIARVREGESTLQILNLNSKLKSFGVEFE